MKGFSSKQDFVRYGHLFALSSLLSNQGFWFNGDLFSACTEKDYERLRELLIEAVPSLQEFADVIDWKQLAGSAIKVYDAEQEEFQVLENHVKRIILLAKKINLLDAEDEADVF
jgi:hypothetical protein